jgi:general secretion pathway protein D
MTHRSRRALLFVTSLLAMAPCVASAEQTKEAPTPAVGEDEALYRCKPRNAEVAINFKPDMELKELMTWVVGFTCKNFILDPRVVVTGKKITVIAPNKMSSHEAYRLFLVSLSTMNLTVVPKGNVLRIADAGASRRDTVPIMKKGVPDDDQVVRYILRPTYATTDTLVPALTALKSEIGEVTPIGSMVMMTDYGGNVRDMLSLVKMVDVPKGSEGIYTIAIDHANAKTVATQIGGILGMSPDGSAPAPSKAPPGGPPLATAAFAPSKVMVDERTNTIILAANEVAYERFRALAKRIDVPLDIEGGQSVHVYRLKNALAEELAKTITETFSQNQAPAGAPPRSATPADGPATIDGKVRVIADKPTNSLIVLSNGRDFLALKEVIGGLDLPRPQVYIEAMFVDVTVSNTMTTEGSLHGASNALDKALMFGGVQTGTISSINPKGAAGAKGIVTGLVGSSVSVLGLTIPSYAVLFNAIQDKSKANVLSTPSMMALDNETAKFKMGTSIPFQKGLSYAGLNSTDVQPGSANVSIDRIDLNIELEVKPHISGDESVLLELKHDAKELQESNNTLGPQWSTRSFETRVLVRDQQTIVIGGMMQERQLKSISQVPLLGDIPLLGRLFRYERNTKQKTNLIILLTPYIVHNELELQAIKERKLREHQEFVGSLQSFESMKYIPKLDYAKKRGLVEEINVAIKGIEEDARNLERVGKPIVVPTGPIELPDAD